MKKLILVFLAVLMLTSCLYKSEETVEIKNVSPPPVTASSDNSNLDKPAEIKRADNKVSEYIPLNFDEQKAIWLSYIDLAPMFADKSEQSFSNNFESACQNIKNLGCNTIYVHVRSFGDAYYQSDYFAWSKNITGDMGAKPTYDPLEIMINIAHRNGLSFHAWINPLRCETEENFNKIDDSFEIKKWYNDSEKYPEYLVKIDSDKHYWLNPAASEVRDLISNGVKEIVENYQVDGIHIDDYFYPTTEKTFDAESYVEAGVSLTLSDWRMSNCTNMVKQIHDAIKSINNDILFGVSPQGNIENNYNYMYADVKKWCSEAGYIDYIVPQVYFSYENSAKPFEQTINDWSDVVSSDSVSLVIGLAPYKIMEDDDFNNTVGVIANQIKSSEKLLNCHGIALYNYINIFSDNTQYAKRMSEERDHIEKALK